MFNGTTLWKNVSNNSFDSELQDRINSIQLIVCPILLVIGVLGNTCIVLTVTHPRFRQITTRFFLCALAFSDSLAILTNPFNQMFMISLSDRDPRALSTFGCKLFFVVYRTGKLTSSWFIVAVAVERFIAVIYPLRVKEILKKRNALIVIGVVYFVVTMINSVWSFSTGISDGICLPDLVPEGGIQRHKMHIILAAILYTFAPFLILLCVTPPIILKLVYHSKQRHCLVQGQCSKDRYSTETSRISLMLVVVVVAWSVWIMPITIVLIHTLWTNEPILGSTKKDLVILQTVAQFFEQVNHSCNFIIYVLFSTQFRNRFWQMIKTSCCLRRLFRDKSLRKFNSEDSGMKITRPYSFSDNYPGANARFFSLMTSTTVDNVEFYEI